MAEYRRVLLQLFISDQLGPGDEGCKNYNPIHFENEKLLNRLWKTVYFIRGRYTIASKFITLRRKWNLITFKDGNYLVITRADAMPNEWIQEHISGKPVHTR